MNENRRDNQDMLENIIEDLSRENEFKVEDEVQPDTPRRPKPAPKKSGGKLWPAVIAAIIILAATYYIFKSGSEPIETPAQPETPAAAEETAASQAETLFPPAETPAETPGESAAAINTPVASPPAADEPAATDASAPANEQPPAAPETEANADVVKQESDSASDPLSMAEEEKAKAEEAARLTAEEKAEAEANKKAAEEKAKAEAAAKAAVEAKAETEAAQKEAEAKAAEAAKADPASESAPTAPTEAPAAAAPATNTSESNKAPLPTISKLWVVNVSSTPDKAESLAILTKVMASDAGGQVYAYETTVDGKKQNRIRVGFFTSRAEAEAMGQKLQETHKLSSSPWPVQPTEEEVSRYKK